MKSADTTSPAFGQRAARSTIHLRPAQRSAPRCSCRVPGLAVKTTCRLRATRAVTALASYHNQGPYLPGPGAGEPGPRRIVRRPRDLQQLTDVLSSGAADDPEQFLQLLSTIPGVLGRRRAPLPPSEQDAARKYVRQLQLQQQQQQQQQAAAAAAAAAAEAQQRAQQQEEEQRREALRAAMLQNARRHLPQYDSDSLARLASGLAAAGVRDPALCDDILRQVMSRRARQPPQLPAQQLQHARQAHSASEPRSLAELLDAFAAMRHRPSDAQLAELLRIQQQEQQRETELERLRQAQAQQALRSQPRFQPRGMVVPEAKAPPPPPSPPQPDGSRTSAEDAARLLYALSRLGYSPDEGTLAQLLDQLQPQRLQLQAVPPPNVQEQRQAQQAASGSNRLPYGRFPAVAWLQGQPPPQRQAQLQAQLQDQGREEDGEEQQQANAAETRDDEGDDGPIKEMEDQLSYSLQRDAQAVASAVRALERMGRPDKAQQLRERFMGHVQEVRSRVAREREARRQQEQEHAGERDRAAAAAAEAAERQRERQAAAEVQRRQLHEEQARALRLQLTRKLRAADQWQQIRALLFTYQEALDMDCLTAAAARLAELLAAARRTGWGLAMTLRESGELGGLLEGLGQLVLRRLEGASAAQAACLLSSVVRMRHLEEGLLVGLLRRLRDTLGDAGGEELSATLRALAACGVRPSRPWMETFLARCEEMLPLFSPDDLAVLPVCLAQLGAHPGRSWLGSYLDMLQEREGELSQAAVSEAVRSVALLDRPFLSAWRQAVTAREQHQAQAQAQARAAAAAAAAAQKVQGQQQKQQEEQQTAEQQRAPADALASVDEMLGRSDDRQDVTVQEELLPPMHPKQRGMSGELSRAGVTASEQRQDSAAQSSARARGSQAPPATAATETMRLSDLFPTQSIELDVDNADLSYDGGAPAKASGVSSSTEPAAQAAVDASSAPAAIGGARQLPGSFSVDGFYSPDPYDDYGVSWEDHVDEEEGEEAEEEDLDAIGVPPNQSAAALSSHAGEASEEQAGVRTAAATQTTGTKAPTQPKTSTAGYSASGSGDTGYVEEAQTVQAVPVAASSSGQQHPNQPDEQRQHQGKKQQQQQQAVAEKAAASEPMAKQKPAPTPEELAQARALRSLLLERYEALLALRAEREEKERQAEVAAAAGPDGQLGSRSPSDREVAAAAKLLAAREQLQRLEADFENIKRRAKAEREEAVARAGAETLRPLLSLADNFERAEAQIKPKTAGERAVHNAYQAVYRELQEVLKKAGVQEVGVVGQQFDPNEHEAVMREDRDDVEDGTVTGVFQKGYRLGNVLVRPALVKVAYS